MLQETRDASQSRSHRLKAPIRQPVSASLISKSKPFDLLHRSRVKHCHQHPPLQIVSVKYSPIEMLINSVIALSLALCKAAAATIIFRPNSANRQSALIGPSLPSITDPEDPNKVPGHNNVNYGPVPEAEQLFKLEYLEIAPTPIPVYDKTWLSVC